MIWQSQEFDLTVEEAEEYAAQIGSLIAVSEVYGGLPSGGSAGEILIKNSEEDYDASWYAPASVVEDGNELPVTSEAVYDAVSVKYTKPSDGIPADDLAERAISSRIWWTNGQIAYRMTMKTIPISQLDNNTPTPGGVPLVPRAGDIVVGPKVGATDGVPRYLYIIGSIFQGTPYGDLAVLQDFAPSDYDGAYVGPLKVSELQNDSGFGTYSKPNGGIPASDLASDVLLLPEYVGGLVGHKFLHVSKSGIAITHSWEQVNDFKWIELSVDANDNIVSTQTAANVVRGIERILNVDKRHPAIHLTLNNGFVISLPLTSYKNSSSNISFSTISGNTSYAINLVKKPNTPYYFSYSHTDLTPAGIGAIAAPNSPSSNQALWFDGALWGSKTILPSDVGAIPEPNDLLGDSFLYRHSNGGWVCLASGDAYDVITNGKSATFIDASVSGSTMTIYEEPGVIFDLLVGAGKTYIATEDEEPRFFYPVKFNDTTGCISVECIVGRTLYSCDLYPSNAPDYDQMSGTIVSTAVPTSASDLGAYVKPSGGIPKTDLASDVQTSLGKADTALQSVPSTYRTAAAQDTIDAAQDSAIAAIKGIYWCIYGTTTNSEIQAALDGGILPVALRNGDYYMYSGYDSQGYVFTRSTLSSMFRISCKNNVWSAGMLPIPQLSSATPAALGTASAGRASSSSKADHVHPMPSAADIGAVATNQGAANANKVLTVNSSGVVVPEDNRFVVTLTPTAADYSGTMDKTVAEIYTAWEAGKEIWFRVYAGTDFTDVPCDRMGKSSLAYPSFNAAMLYDEANMFVLIYTATTSDGSQQTYSTKLYPLATGQWTGGSY